MDEPAILIEAETVNGERYDYWRQFLKCSNGQVVCGIGDTKVEAESKARESREKIEAQLHLSAIEQLKLLAAQERILDADQERMLRLIVSILEKL
jgi:uncharacterized Zn finger protein (UPF0148 family)